jgi:hypothetical protein
MWSSEIDGMPQEGAHKDPVLATGVIDVWHKKKAEISKEEYRFLCGHLKDWARTYYPEHPLLNIREPVVPSKLRPIPEYRAPEAIEVDAEALDQVLTAVNAPSQPKPLTIDQINNYLHYEYETLRRQIHQDVAQMTEDAATACASEADVQRLGANLSIVDAHLRVADDARSTVKRPFLEGGKAVDRWFNLLRQILVDAAQPVRNMLHAYAERIEHDRRLAAEEEAQALREEAARAEAEAVRAIQTNPDSAFADAKLHAAIDAANASKQADGLALGRAADLTRTNNAYGGVMSAQEVWSWELTDIKQIPVNYLTTNDVLINKAVRDWAKSRPDQARAGIVPFLGIRIVRKVEMKNRR